MSEGDMWNKIQKEADLPRIKLPKNITGPIVGYRFWYPWQQSYFGWSPASPTGLCSVAVNYLWNPSPNRAVNKEVFQLILGNSNPPISSHNNIGLYGLKEPIPQTFGILGLALYWGTIEIHKEGWRAEYAQPLALIRNEYWPLLSLEPNFTAGMPSFTIDQIADQYGIPIVDEEGAKKIIEEWNGGGST